MMDRNKETARCLCGMCPSFVDCGETITFCLAETGTSGCIRSEQGCLCPGVLYRTTGISSMPITAPGEAKPGSPMRGNTWRRAVGE